MEPIRLMTSTFFREEAIKEKLLQFIRESDRLSMGPVCEKYEQEFAKYQGRQYSVGFNSGSSANLALIQALVNLGRLKAGDRVGFSAVTWSTNVMPLIQLGLRPVPIDVKLETLNIDSTRLLDTIQSTPLKALFITNLLGLCGDLDVIRKICDEKGILLLEDNCESLGTVFHGKKLGNFGEASSFSTFVGHHLSTIEGGMVCTDDEKIYDMLKMARAHGWIRNLDDSKRQAFRTEHHIDEFYEQYSFFELGYNLRPTEITGFLGLQQLEYADEIIAIRARNFKQFLAASHDNPNLVHLESSHISLVSNMAFPVVCRSKEIRNACIQRFRQAKVEIRPIVAGNMVRQPFFAKHVPERSGDVLPNSDQVHDCGFYFPNHPEMTNEELDRLSNLLVQ